MGDPAWNAAPGWTTETGPVQHGDYRERARAVYWNRDFPACRARGFGNAECLLNPEHPGPHFGNGFDNYGPTGAKTWESRPHG